MPRKLNKPEMRGIFFLVEIYFSIYLDWLCLNLNFFKKNTVNKETRKIAANFRFNFLCNAKVEPFYRFYKMRQIPNLLSPMRFAMSCYR